MFENTKGFLNNFLEPFVDLFAWGILERHPKLKMVMAEAGTGWLPWLMQELDYRHWRLWEAKEFWADKGGMELETKPSELFRRQCHMVGWFDATGLKTRHHIGLNNLLWSTNFPQATSTWPESRNAIARAFQDVPENVRRQVLVDNAAKLYKLA